MKTADIKVRLDKQTKRALKVRAKRELLKLSDIVRRAIHMFLENDSSDRDPQRSGT